MELFYNNPNIVCALYSVLTLFSFVVYISCLHDKFWLGDNSYKHFVWWVTYNLILDLSRLELLTLLNVTNNTIAINTVGCITYIAFILNLNSGELWLMCIVNKNGNIPHTIKYILNIISTVLITSTIIFFLMEDSSYLSFAKIGFPPFLKIIHVGFFVFFLSLLAIFVYYRKNIDKKDFKYLFVFASVPTVLCYHRQTFGLIFSIFNFLIITVNYFKIWQQKKYNMLSKEKELAEQTNAMHESNIDNTLSKIKPRFLYDTLDIITEYCDKNPETAYKITLNFSSYLRYSLSALKSGKPVMLSDELKQVKTYVEIQKVIARGVFSVDYDIGADFEIPSMSLQLLVENAFKHIDGKRGPGKISVAARKTDDGCFISIEDNGSYYNSKEKESAGIKSVSQRLKVQFNGSLYFEHNNDNFGTASRIVIPGKKETRPGF